ncbi:MAG: hypothetical protein Q7U75_12170, partial [Desulfobacterales bacterium]|nr:hypothetical protein [Desulfobacterales bacterium]
TELHPPQSDLMHRQILFLPKTCIEIKEKMKPGVWCKGRRQKTTGFDGGVQTDAQSGIETPRKVE